MASRTEPLKGAYRRLVKEGCGSAVCVGINSDFRNIVQSEQSRAGNLFDETATELSGKAPVYRCRAHIGVLSVYQVNVVKNTLVSAVGSGARLDEGMDCCFVDIIEQNNN